MSTDRRLPWYGSDDLETAIDPSPDLPIVDPVYDATVAWLKAREEDRQRVRWKGWRRKLWLIMKLYRVPILAMDRFGTWYAAWQLWLSLWRDADTHWFRRAIVRAAPTCTLWRHASINMDALEFVLWPRWKISGIEQVEAA